MSENLEKNNTNYLKREKLIESVDGNKIWSKSMTIPEVKNTLDSLERIINTHKYVSDKNFLMDGRRYFLKNAIEERLTNNKNNIDEEILDVLFNFFEFLNNEYYTALLGTQERLHLSQEEIEKKCSEYKQKGIICLEEKDVIIEMIQSIKSSIKS